MPVQRRLYRFGNVDIDIANLQITVDGAIRPLEPKAFRLLQFLIENPGRAVSKDEILAAVWPDAAVTDNALTRAIAQLRKALGDHSREPRFIETIPTIGYRFLIQPDSQLETVPPPPSPSSRRPVLLLAVIAILLLSLAAVAYRQTRQTPAAPTFRSNAQVTSSNGLDINAAFSPDGHLLAYASDRTGAFEIYVRPLDAGARETRITANAGQNLFPSFSPDGQAIAYSALRTPGIYRTPAFGGAVERLTSFGAQPAWSPDGKWIVFLSHGRPTLGTTDYYWPAPDSSLWIVSANGGTPRQIASRAKLEGGQAFPSWSSDGREIRFVNYASRVASLWTYRLDGDVLEKRFELPAGATLGSAIFSRDSRRLYYISSKLNGDIGVWSLRLNALTLTPVGKPEPMYQPSIGVPRDLALSPDGARLAFTTILSKSRILIQNLTGDQPAGDPMEFNQETGFRHSVPGWSPDGRAIVYTKLPVGRRAQSWVNRLDGSPPIPIGRGIQAHNYPHFRPDGKVIRQLVKVPGEPDEIQDVSLDDGSVTNYPAGTRLDQPTFSPDGRSAAFHTEEPIHQVWKLDIRSRLRTQLTFGADPHGFAIYSADGAWLLVQRLRNGGSEIWAVPAAGGKLEPIVDRPGTWYAGDWSRDGRRILVAGNSGSGWALHSVSRETRQLRRITPDLPLRMYLRYPRWSPAGSRLAYEFNESKGNVFIAGIGE
jgi:Tol biopolymer transport system component/DNA-binding winged helix-turn-helix (wHTH) protein